MSFQVSVVDRIHERRKIKVSVADSEEDFNNTTVEELKRKLFPRDERENAALIDKNGRQLEDDRTLGSYGVKHQDYITAIRRKQCGAANEDDDDDDDWPSALSFSESFRGRIPGHWGVKCCSEFAIEESDDDDEESSDDNDNVKDDEDEDKKMPRSQSMDNLALMQQPDQQ